MSRKSRTQNKDDHSMLWWISILAIGISASVYILMGKQAEIDIAAERTRLLFPLIGIIIAGLCFICGISKKWFSRH
ncbi:MAG: hypothetical protein ACJZ86_01795 [Pontiellaceae bacterium]